MKSMSIIETKKLDIFSILIFMWWNMVMDDWNVDEKSLNNNIVKL